MNAAAQPDTCPRCGGGFACGAAGAAPCPCTTVTLSAERQEQLRQDFVGCLCMNCLGEIAQADAQAEAQVKAQAEAQSALGLSLPPA